MSKKSPRPGSLQDYMAEVLKNAVYEKGEQLDVIVAEAPDLPGCITQGANFEEAREISWMPSKFGSCPDCAAEKIRLLSMVAVWPSPPGQPRWPGDFTSLF